MDQLTVDGLHVEIDGAGRASGAIEAGIPGATRVVHEFPAKG